MSAGTATDSAEAWLAQVLALERRGELLLAYDTACRALQAHPDDLSLRHRAVLLLARAGSTEQAQRRFHELRLDREPAEEVAALGARLEKDLALALPPHERAPAALRAAERYLAIGRKAGDDTYPLINAATLLLLAGEADRAADLSRDLLRRPDRGDYWSAATAAEAWLVVGDTDQAGTALAAASGRADGDWAAVASTRRQLEFVCDAHGFPRSILGRLSAPTVAHFCGHRMATESTPGIAIDAETLVARRIAEELDRRSVHFAYGSLANGADLMWAEGLLDRGAELHVVLPFDRQSFVVASVAPAGAGWVERFHAVLQRATSISFVTEDTADHDDALFAAAADQAMGTALLRARFLSAGVVQLAVWDGNAAGGAAGTARDVERWRGTGRDSVLITPPGETNRWSGQAPLVAPPSRHRAIRCLLFADVAGYTRMTDNQLMAFQELTGTVWATALAGLGEEMLSANTWGDALFVVLSDVVTAARCAVALRDSFRAIDFSSHGLPPLGLRVAVHVGPVFEGYDPVTGRPSWTGIHVNRAARLEPVTPVGEVYVTEAFAAALELAGDGSWRCEYVGHLPTAKGYEALRMHRLHRVVRHRTSPARPG
ncbi:MAG TPA: tetratricopeptide repeat-containing protein [Mycobacteriales bacterium]|nr:tetratricopeptide repeat-containing protein [Mycobacteriales bacterium]